MTEDVPADVRRQFEESVSFVVVIDLLREHYDGIDQSTLEGIKEEHESVIFRLMDAYPTLEPTTEGFNPATVVADEFEADGVFESHPQLSRTLSMIENWFEGRDEPFELQSRPGPGRHPGEAGPDGHPGEAGPDGHPGEVGPDGRLDEVDTDADTDG